LETLLLILGLVVLSALGLRWLLRLPEARSQRKSSILIRSSTHL